MLTGYAPCEGTRILMGASTMRHSWTSTSHMWLLLQELRHCLGAHGASWSLRFEHCPAYRPHDPGSSMVRAYDKYRIRRPLPVCSTRILAQEHTSRPNFGFSRPLNVHGTASPSQDSALRSSVLIRWYLRPCQRDLRHQPPDSGLAQHQCRHSP